MGNRLFVIAVAVLAALPLGARQGNVITRRPVTAGTLRRALRRPICCEG